MKNGQSISFVAWGPYALFTRPETRSDRVSYSVITPSACQGLASNICGKPEMRWDIMQVAILRPWWIGNGFDYPKTMTMKRNEIKNAPAIRTIVQAINKGVLPKRINVAEDRTQRVSLLLKDVAYCITMRPVILNGQSESAKNKYLQMIHRRLEKGQFFRKPYFGCREYAANTRLSQEDDEVMDEVNMDCGLMVHHLNYGVYPPKPVWFHAVIKDGILNCDASSKDVEIYQ